jgi:hypothetical protein
MNNICICNYYRSINSPTNFVNFSLSSTAVNQMCLYRIFSSIRKICDFLGLDSLLTFSFVLVRSSLGIIVTKLTVYRTKSYFVIVVQKNVGEDYSSFKPLYFSIFSINRPT